MRIICDAPEQTCNRLWTYVASVAQCIAEHRRMVIIFYDWTIEDFPNLLHCPFIHFPLWQKWYLERGNGWNNYKGLTWKVTHNKTWDRIFQTLGFKKGWTTMHDTRYLVQTKRELQHIFRPREAIMQQASRMMADIRQEADIIVGVHIRHGDYKTFFNGRYYYTLEEFHQFMLRIQALYNDRRVAFFISSNEPFDVSIFKGCRCHRFGKEPSGDIIVCLLVFNIFIFLSRGVVENYISAHGLFSDVWAAWTELALNLAVTLCLAPFLGIIGILLGKVVSVFFIAVFWKPYFLFSRGLKKSVTVYWRGMALYYLLFALFTAVALLCQTCIISPNVHSLPALLLYATLTYPPLLAVYFLALFYATTGLKYFVARQPRIYRLLHR